MVIFEGTVVAVNSESFYQPDIGRKVKIKSYGECIDYIIQDANGDLYAVSEDEGAVTKIDTTPFLTKSPA